MSRQVGKRRSYTLQDVEMFRRIAAYSKQGKNLDAIEADLKITMPRVRRADPAGLTVHPEVLRVLEEINNQNMELQLQVDKLTARLDWLSLPWWKRLFSKQPEQASADHPVIIER